MCRGAAAFVLEAYRLVGSAVVKIHLPHTRLLGVPGSHQLGRGLVNKTSFNTCDCSTLVTRVWAPRCDTSFPRTGGDSHLGVSLGAYAGTLLRASVMPDRRQGGAGFSGRLFTGSMQLLGGSSTRLVCAGCAAARYGGSLDFLVRVQTLGRPGIQMVELRACGGERGERGLGGTIGGSSRRAKAPNCRRADGRSRSGGRCRGLAARGSSDVSPAGRQGHHPSVHLAPVPYQPADRLC
jgi:hypothetical protein